MAKEVKCKTCDGRGHLECRPCKGTGEQWGVFTKAHTCPTCRGSGKVECAVCCGTGYVTKRDEDYYR